MQAGFLTINEARALEDLTPQTDPTADSVRVPLAQVNSGDSTLRAEREKVSMARDLIWGGYDPAGILAAVGLPPIEHTGLPSVQLQQVVGIDPEDPLSVYTDGEE